MKQLKHMKQLKIEKRATVRTQSITALLTEVARIPILEAAEEEHLVRLSQRGDLQARNKLISANMRFVVSVAKKYAYMGLPLEDLIAFGSEGLMTAVERFDPSRGFKLISYAVWHIRQRIMDGLNSNAYTVKVPFNKIAMYRKLVNEADMLTKELGVDVSMNMAAEFDGYRIDQLLGLNGYTRPISISTTVNPDQDLTLEGLLPGDDNQIEDMTQTDARCRLVKALRKILRDDEYQVIIQLYGFNDRAMSVTEISVKMRLSVEHVRSIRDRAHNRIKRLAASKPETMEFLQTLCN